MIGATDVPLRPTTRGGQKIRGHTSRQARDRPRKPPTPFACCRQSIVRCRSTSFGHGQALHPNELSLLDHHHAWHHSTTLDLVPLAPRAARDRKRAAHALRSFLLRCRRSACRTGGQYCRHAPFPSMAYVGPYPRNLSVAGDDSIVMTSPSPACRLVRHSTAPTLKADLYTALRSPPYNTLLWLTSLAVGTTDDHRHSGQWLPCHGRRDALLPLPLPS